MPRAYRQLLTPARPRRGLPSCPAFLSPLLPAALAHPARGGPPSGRRGAPARHAARGGPSGPTRGRALLAGTAAARDPAAVGPRLTGGYGLLLTMLGRTRFGWPVVAGGTAAAGRGPDRGARVARRRGRHRDAGPPPGRPPRRRPPCCWMSRRGSSPAWPGAGSRPGTAGRCSASGTGRAVCKVDWALSGPVPLDGPTPARDARLPCTWAGPWLRSPPPKPMWPPAGTRTGRSASSPSPAWSILAGPPPASTHPLGLLPRPPPGLADRHEQPDRGADRPLLRPGFRDLILAPLGPHCHPAGAAQPQLASAATSTAAPPPSGQTLFRPTMGWKPLSHPRSAGVYLCSASNPRRAAASTACAAAQAAPPPP